MDHFAGGTLRSAKVKWSWDDGSHKAKQADKLNPTSPWKVVGILARVRHKRQRERERERESVHCSRIRPGWSTKTRVSCAIGQKMLTSTLQLTFSLPLFYPFSPLQGFANVKKLSEILAASLARLRNLNRSSKNFSLSKKEPRLQKQARGLPLWGSTLMRKLI